MDTPILLDLAISKLCKLVQRTERSALGWPATSRAAIGTAQAESAAPDDEDRADAPLRSNEAEQADKDAERKIEERRVDADRKAL
jgi:hypothetical protein